MKLEIKSSYLDGKVVTRSSVAQAIRNAIKNEVLDDDVDVTNISDLAYKILNSKNIDKDIDDIILDTTEIELPANTVMIGYQAFSDFINLKHINIPDNIFRIAEAAFCNCESLEEITLPSKLKEISSISFANCKTLKEIYIPNSVACIESSAFMDCQNLERVVINGEQMEYIGRHAFDHCPNLKEIILNKSTKIPFISRSALDFNNNINILFYTNINMKCQCDKGECCIKD